MQENWLQLLQDFFVLTEANIGDNAQLKVGPMKFSVRQWRVDGIGNLSYMKGSAMFGLMKMDTLILTPIHRDAPLFSYDRIKAMGKDTMLIEFYNTMLGSLDPLRSKLDEIEQKNRLLQQIPDYQTGERWYDSLKLKQSIAKTSKKDSAQFDAVLLSVVKSYLQLLTDAQECDAQQKCRKTQEYVGGLLEHGGASTDHFLKAFGRQRVDDIFYKILFGIRE